jgi:hypothetical protein
MAGIVFAKINEEQFGAGTCVKVVFILWERGCPFILGSPDFIDYIVRTSERPLLMPGRSSKVPGQVS